MILLVGGGSGGHVTPLVALAEGLAKATKEELWYAGQRGDRFAEVVLNDPRVSVSKLIFAGKFRRYHSEGWRQMFDLKTQFFNLRDFFKVLIGLWQAFWFLLFHRPKVIFIKGGFVGVPIGLAAALLRIPYITHDSDALPGLANRIIGRWARVRTAAVASKAHQASGAQIVGVPVSAEFDGLTKIEARSRLKIPHDCKMIFITGGGQGAIRMNTMVTDALAIAPKDVVIAHQAGKDDLERTLERYNGRSLTNVFAFTDMMPEMVAAADIVISRAGATSIAEFAAAGKACVIIPNPFLTGGHQLHNAEALEGVGAITVVKEGETRQLQRAVTELLDSQTKRDQLGQSLHQSVATDAVDKLVPILMKFVGK